MKTMHLAYLGLFVLWLFPSITWIQEIRTQASYNPSLGENQNFFTFVIHWTYRVLLFNPLKVIYLHGPSLSGFGFWNGQELPDICAQLSKGVGTMRFWQENLDQCESQIDKQVVALCILVWFIFFIVAFYLVIQMSMWQYYQYAVLRPALSEFWAQKLRHHHSSKNHCNKLVS
jgi:hypothetical protein